MSPPRDRDESEGAEPREGWESLGEDDGALAPNPELEAAMREAMDAVEARQGERRREEGGGDAEAARLASELAAAQDRLLRLQAEFENFRKRTLKEREEAWRYGHQNVVKDLLPTVDNLERAIEHARSSGSGDLEGLLQGVDLVLRELRTVLERHGVAEIEDEGLAFDPAVHEAMAKMPSETAAPNEVIQVFEKGYRLRDRLLRPARVVVAVAPGKGGGAPDEPEEEKGD